jgi:hypothetical protein
VKFPLTSLLVDEARRFELRSACRDCFFWRERAGDGGACAHDWPDEGQRRWPLDAPNPDGSMPTEVAFCKEFELA